MPSGISPNQNRTSTRLATATPAEKIPAVIIVRNEAAALRIAALPVLDRLVVAIYRAGAAPIIIVSANPLPLLERARALRIPLEHAGQLPEFRNPTLLAAANMLVQPADIRRCIEERARLLSNDGEPLEIGMVEASSSLDEIPAIRAGGIARPVRDQASATAAERALWESLTSSSDGLVDKYFNRPCGRLLSKLLIYTSVSPNMVSIVSILLGVLSAFFLADGASRSAIIGALIFQLSAIIDCIDGDLARVLFKESPLGKWIDFAGDQIVHVSVFAGIAPGVATSAGSPALWLGISAVAGALRSFGVVLRGMRSPSGQTTLLKKLIDAATNRDFSVLVLVLALAGSLDLFLWMAGIGRHIFWIAALAIQLGTKRSESVEPVTGS